MTQFNHTDASQLTNEFSVELHTYQSSFLRTLCWLSVEMQEIEHKTWPIHDLFVRYCHRGM